jgi:hypothetical protein
MNSGPISERRRARLQAEWEALQRVKELKTIHRGYDKRHDSLTPLTREQAANEATQAQAIAAQALSK